MRRALSLFAIGAALLTAPALAAVEEVRLQVKGLACPFCTFGIEKNLKKLPGVLSVETTIRTGIVRIRLKPNATLDFVGFQKAVAKSGFTFDHLEATVTGRLVSRDGHTALETRPAGPLFLLVEPNREEVSEELSAETLKKLNGASENGSKPLTVTGRAHGHAGMPPALSVESFEAAK